MSDLYDLLYKYKLSQLDLYADIGSSVNYHPDKTNSMLFQKYSELTTGNYCDNDQITTSNKKCFLKYIFRKFRSFRF